MQTIDDTEYFQSCNLPSILCGLTLCVIEVRRNGNHCMLNFAPKIRFGSLLHLRQDHSRQFFWGK